MGAAAWGISDLIGSHQLKLKKLPGVTGLFDHSRFGNMENGWTQGHIRSNQSSSRSIEDAFDSFVYYENGHIQSADANEGAWRNLEKSMQYLVKDGRFETINYGGVLWKDITYKALDGTTQKSKSHILELPNQSGVNTTNIPVPSAFWRFTLVVPRVNAEGKPISRAQGLLLARPIATIVPNKRDADLLVSGWERFNTSPVHLETMLDRQLPSFLEDILGDYKQRIDDGKRIPKSEDTPNWKLERYLELVAPNSRHVSPEAKKHALQELKAQNVDIERGQHRRSLRNKEKAKLKFNRRKKSKNRASQLEALEAQEKKMAFRDMLLKRKNKPANSNHKKDSPQKQARGGKTAHNGGKKRTRRRRK